MAEAIEGFDVSRPVASPDQAQANEQAGKHLDDLSDWLGYDHDLIVLSEYIRQHKQLSAAEREDLLDTVQKHRKEHLTAARHVAAIVFEPRPTDFARNVERWRKRWRTK